MKNGSKRTGEAFVSFSLWLLSVGRFGDLLSQTWGTAPGPLPAKSNSVSSPLILSLDPACLNWPIGRDLGRMEGGLEKRRVEGSHQCYSQTAMKSLSMKRTRAPFLI